VAATTVSTRSRSPPTGRRRAVESLHRADHADEAPPEHLDQPDVEDRDDVVLASPRVEASRGRRHTVPAQIADGDPACRRGDRVDEPGRNVTKEDAQHLAGKPSEIPTDDVRWRADRQDDPACATLDQIDGDLGTRVPRADHEHVAPLSNGRGFRFSLAWTTRPVNESMPGQTGVQGTRL
jgi:hypothetical protein